MRLPGSPPAVLVASEATVLLATTAYEFLGPSGNGTAKLPDPRPIVATLGFYALLGMVGTLGARARVLSAWAGGLIAVTVLVTGARGKAVATYLQQLAKLAAPAAGSG